MIDAIVEGYLDNQVEGERLADQWDGPNILSIVMEGRRPNEEANILLVMLTGGAELPTMLWAMTDAILDGTAPLTLSAPLLGVTLRFEGWGFKADTPEEVRAHKEYIERGGMIADHPKGIEYKAFMALDIYGEHAHRDIARSGEPWTHPDMAFEGRVPDGLTALMNAIKSLPIVG